ncbi:DUF6380 family protein [Streptomyces sp. NPDC001480]
MDPLGEDDSTPGTRHATLRRGAASLTATVRGASFRQHDGPAQEGAR